MPRRDDTSKLDALLASVNDEMLGDDLSRQFDDNTVKVERILLDLVRPDPVQPRRVLPERIHHAFHNSQLTPSQALRELVQIAQVAARQRGRPFTSLQELLPDPDRDDGPDTKPTPEEALLRDLVTLAATISDDGQVNPITVVDLTQGVTHQYRIETGERRYWAAWLLRDFLPDYQGDGLIDCIVVPTERATVFRQAKENTARKGLSAIAMARQAALLLLSVNRYEIPDYAIDNDFYRQALELRIQRGQAQELYAAMGGINKRRFSQYKDLLRLCDEAIELADRHCLDERTLRHLISLSCEDQVEMIQQIIQFGLTSRQVEAIVSPDSGNTEEASADEPPAFMTKFVRSFIKDADRFSSELLWAAVYREQGDPHMASAYLKRLAQMAFSAASRYSAEGDKSTRVDL